MREYVSEWVRLQKSLLKNGSFQYLIIRFSVVVQIGDMVEENAKLIWEALEHEAMVVRLLHISDLFLY